MNATVRKATPDDLNMLITFTYEEAKEAEGICKAWGISSITGDGAKFTEHVVYNM